MRCPSCNTDLATGQQVCHGCGANVAHITAGGSLPPPPAGLGAPAGNFTIVEQTAPPTAPPWQVPPAQPFAPGSPVSEFPQPSYQQPTYQQPATVAQPGAPGQPLPYGSAPVYAGLAAPPPVDTTRPPKNASALAVVGILAGAAAIIGSFLPMLTVKTDAPVDPRVLGDYKLNDFIFLAGTNFQVAFIVAGVALVIGALAARAGKRVGAGLAAGAGLMLIPFTVYAWGCVSLTSDQSLVAAEASGGGSFIERTTGVGIYVLLAAAVLGVIALFLAFSHSAPDGRKPLQRAVCGIGALAALVAAAGQLIPQNGASFGDNFDADLSSATLIYSRLGIIAVVAIAGAAGFLLTTRWGVGLALGGMAMYAWQWITSLLEAGDLPFPPAFGNPGADELKPHIVTTIGVIAMLALAAVAFISSRSDPQVT